MRRAQDKRGASSVLRSPSCLKNVSRRYRGAGTVLPERTARLGLDAASDEPRDELPTNFALDGPAVWIPISGRQTLLRESGETSTKFDNSALPCVWPTPEKTYTQHGRRLSTNAPSVRKRPRNVFAPHPEPFLHANAARLRLVDVDGGRGSSRASGHAYGIGKNGLHIAQSRLADGRHWMAVEAEQEHVVRAGTPRSSIRLLTGRPLRVSLPSRLRFLSTRRVWRWACALGQKDGSAIPGRCISYAVFEAPCSYGDSQEH
jgi:hypothetical protein